eukprot:GEMP01025602.1.p2 GENE.GEMP01025602.1~~GEMP01025602.1.p2  ORF type:complete len:212 (+),score=26.11 GEMP01025602.1:88-723(+)
MMDRPTSKSSASETHGVSPLAIVHPTPENPTNQMSPISVRSSRNSQSCTSDDSEISKLVLASTPSPFKELGYGHYLAALEQARSKITYFASNVESCIIATPELVRKMQVRRPGDPMAFTGLPASSTAEAACWTNGPGRSRERAGNPSVHATSGAVSTATGLPFNIATIDNTAPADVSTPYAVTTDGAIPTNVAFPSASGSNAPHSANVDIP